MADVTENVRRAAAARAEWVPFPRGRVCWWCEGEKQVECLDCDAELFLHRDGRTHREPCTECNATGRAKPTKPPEVGTQAESLVTLLEDAVRRAGLEVDIVRHVGHRDEQFVRVYRERFARRAGGWDYLGEVGLWGPQHQFPGEPEAASFRDALLLAIDRVVAYAPDKFPEVNLKEMKDDAR